MTCSALVIDSLLWRVTIRKRAFLPALDLSHLCV